MNKYIKIVVVLMLLSTNLKSENVDSLGCANVEEIILVFRTHFDIGYTDLAKNVVEYYRTKMIDKALALVDSSEKHPAEFRFTWSIPGWPMQKILDDWEGQTKERTDRVIKALYDKRFVLDGLPFTTHTESLELQDLIYGISISDNISKRLGMNFPEDAKMTDVPCHVWVLPTLLKHSGINFLHIGCNSLVRKADTPLLFYWQGPDGSKVLTMHSKGYGSGRKFGSGLLPPKSWPYKTWLALIHTSDNQGPPSSDAIEAIMEQVKNELPGVNVHVGRFSDFADAIINEEKGGSCIIPVIKKDMPDPWIHGVLSNPQGEKLSNKVRPLISSTGYLNSILNSFNIFCKNANDSIEKAKEQSLLYGEHTWGGMFGFLGYEHIYGQKWQRMLKNGLDEGHRKLEMSWEEHSNYINRAHAIITNTFNKELKILADNVKKESGRVLVFNSLPWVRSELVEVDFTDVASSHLIDPDDESVIKIEKIGEKFFFYARKIPSVGYKTYKVEKNIEVETNNFNNKKIKSISNDFWELKFDLDNGTLISLFDKKNNRELVNKNSQFKFGQMLYERFSQDECDAYVDSIYYEDANPKYRNLSAREDLPRHIPHKDATPKKFYIEIEEYDILSKVKLKAGKTKGLNFQYSVIFTLNKNDSFLDIEVFIDSKYPDTWPESGWICFPFNFRNAEFKAGRLGSVVDPQHDFIKGSNRDMFYVNTGVSILENGNGVSVFPIDHRLVSLDRPGCMKFYPNFIPKRANLFINLWNNTWNTNFPMWIGGSWSSRIRLLSVSDFDAEKDLQTVGIQNHYPLFSVYSDKKGGKLSGEFSLINISEKGLVLTSLTTSSDGTKMNLGLWEIVGKSGECRVTLSSDSRKIKEVQAVNLRNQRIDNKINFDDHSFVFDLKAYSPHNFVIIK